MVLVVLLRKEACIFLYTSKHAHRLGGQGAEGRRVAWGGPEGGPLALSNCPPCISPMHAFEKQCSAKEIHLETGYGQRPTSAPHGLCYRVLLSTRYQENIPASYLFLQSCLKQRVAHTIYHSWLVLVFFWQFQGVLLNLINNYKVFRTVIPYI